MLLEFYILQEILIICFEFFKILPLMLSLVSLKIFGNREGFEKYADSPKGAAC